MSDARVGADARILERGYRRYTGPRQGQAHAVRSVVAHTLRRILGLRRPARSKVLPLMTIVFAFLPATVFVGLVALLRRANDDGDDVSRQIVPDYPNYYGFVISAIVLFVSFVAPEALCPDRRSRVLSLYLASPLTRFTYLAAKAAAVAAVLAFVTVGPLLLLFVGLVLQGSGPDGFVDAVSVFIQIFEGGIVLAALYTSLSMAIASLTDRRAVAAAATLFLLIGSGIVIRTLVFGLGASTNLLVIDLTLAPLELMRRIYGRPGFFPQIDTWLLTAGVLAMTAASAAIAIARYQRLQVTR